MTYTYRSYVLIGTLQARALSVTNLVRDFSLFVCLDLWSFLATWLLQILEYLTRIDPALWKSVDLVKLMCNRSLLQECLGKVLVQAITFQIKIWIIVLSYMNEMNSKSYCMLCHGKLINSVIFENASKSCLINI